MLKIQIAGNLGRDVESVQSQDGLKKFRFSIGANARKDDPVVWFSVLFVGREGLTPYLRKGARVFVTGNLRQTMSGQYVNNDIFADDVQLLGERTESPT